jgi:hypothetical protein
MEPSMEDENMREVERHHKSHNEPTSSRANSEVIVDPVRFVCIATIIQR